MRKRILALAVCSVACQPANPDAFKPAPSAAELSIVGDPTSIDGATWTFRGTRAGVRYDLAGVLYKPSGSGPFPAVILSHGANGSAARYANRLAPELVKWGLVCIATNYTHASGVSIGAPGGPEERGASAANVQRARMTLEVLRTFAYVDTQRIAAHGHSMGGYVTVALVGTYPKAFRVASQTSGGVRPPRIRAGPAPSEAQASGISAPFQIHHGERDELVDLSAAQRLAALLRRRGIEHELHVYPGADHVAPARSAEMLGHLRLWYESHGMLQR